MSNIDLNEETLVRIIPDPMDELLYYVQAG
jgi:hypothetical protein